MMSYSINIDAGFDAVGTFRSPREREWLDEEIREAVADHISACETEGWRADPEDAYYWDWVSLPGLDGADLHDPVVRGWAVWIRGELEMELARQLAEIARQMADIDDSDDSDDPADPND